MANLILGVLIGVLIGLLAERGFDVVDRAGDWWKKLRS